MPEYGRVSGGQIRFITKSGSNRFSGNAGYYLRDDKLQANTWARNRSPNAFENSGPAPFEFKQYAYSLGGPIPLGGLKEKLFFFGAQEWVNFFQVSHQRRGRSDRQDADGRLQRAARSQQRIRRRSGHHRSDNRTAVPRQRHSDRPPESDRHGDAERLSAANPRFPPGREQRHPEATIRRISARTTSGSTIASMTRTSSLTATASTAGRLSTRSAERSRCAHPLGPAEPDADGELDEHALQQADQRVQLHHSLDEVFINVWRGHRSLPAQQVRDQLPVHLPEKEIPDKIPTITIATSPRSMASPYPASSRGPIYTFNNATTYLKGRHTFKAGISVEYSGQDDFDQINVQPIPGSTNNQNGRFQFTNARANRARHRQHRARRRSPATRRSASGRSRSTGRSRRTSSFRTPGGRPAT